MSSANKRQEMVRFDLVTGLPGGVRRKLGFKKFVNRVIARCEDCEECCGKFIGTF